MKNKWLIFLCSGFFVLTSQVAESSHRTNYDVISLARDVGDAASRAFDEVHRDHRATYTLRASLRNYKESAARLCEEVIREDGRLRYATNELLRAERDREDLDRVLSYEGTNSFVMRDLLRSFEALSDLRDIYEYRLRHRGRINHSRPRVIITPPRIIVPPPRIVVPPRRGGHGRYHPPRRGGNGRYHPPRRGGQGQYHPPRRGGNDQHRPPRSNNGGSNYRNKPPRRGGSDVTPPRSNGNRGSQVNRGRGSRNDRVQRGRSSQGSRGAVRVERKASRRPPSQ